MDGLPIGGEFLHEEVRVQRVGQILVRIFQGVPCMLFVIICDPTKSTKWDEISIKRYICTGRVTLISSCNINVRQSLKTTKSCLSTSVNICRPC